MTAVAVEFDLLSLIRDEYRTNPSADPYVIADAILAKVPEEHYIDALRYCLPQIVRVRRPGSLSNPPPPSAHTPGRKGAQSTSGPKSKTALLKWYAETLNQVIEVGDDQREWKHLRDCTADDLLHAAAYRRELAASNIAKAERFEAVVEKMRTHRAKTVADLDAALLAEALR